MSTFDTDPAFEAPCDKEAMTLFLDGELSLSHQADFFGHLSNCAWCRQVMNGTLDFRRINREERFDVPPWSDDALYRRIEACRDRLLVSNRKHRRVPAWSVRTSMTVRSIVVVLVVVVLSTVIFASRFDNSRSGGVFASQEQIHFEIATDLSREPVYVFYPGVVVESQRED